MQRASRFLQGAAPSRGLRPAAAVFCVALLGGGAAHAAEPIGPVGPIGPTGITAAPARTEPPAAPRAGRAGPAPQRPATPAAPRTGDARVGNRIEVTGNTATGVRCSGDGAASVNSVDVSGARLEGRTVIVQGRNASDVDSARDCPQRPGPPAQSIAAPGQTNGVRIR